MSNRRVCGIRGKLAARYWERRGNELTEFFSNEVIAIIILAACVVLFITNWINTCVAAALGCLAFTLTGICSFNEAFSGFSSNVVILIFSMLIVGDAMAETGADWLIGNFAARISKNNERLFIFAGALVGGLMSMWMANTAVVACFLPILASVSRASPNMTMKNMTMSITFGAMYGGTCTLVGSTSQVAAQGVMYELTGIEFKMFDFMPVGAIMFAAFLVWEQLIGYRMGEKIWGDRQHEGIRYDKLTGKLDVDSFDANHPMHDNKARKRPVFAAIFVVMIIFFVFEWLPVGVTALSAAMLCFITGCADPKETIRLLDWHCVFFLGCCMGIAAGIEATDLGEMMGRLITSLLGPNPEPRLFFAIVVTTVMFTSNFLANATTTVIFCPIVIATCQSYGFNIMPFCLGVVYAANLACATPFAHAQVTMTLVAGYRFSDYVKFNLPVQILMLVIMIIFVPVFFPLM